MLKPAQQTRHLYQSLPHQMRSTRIHPLYIPLPLLLLRRFSRFHCFLSFHLSLLLLLLVFGWSANMFTQTMAATTVNKSNEWSDISRTTTELPWMGKRKKVYGLLFNLLAIFWPDFIGQISRWPRAKLWKLPAGRPINFHIYWSPVNKMLVDFIITHRNDLLTV